MVLDQAKHNLCGKWVQHVLTYSLSSLCVSVSLSLSVSVSVTLSVSVSLSLSDCQEIESLSPGNRLLQDLYSWIHKLANRFTSSSEKPSYALWLLWDGHPTPVTVSQ